MQGVRSALGGLRENARGTQQGLEQTDENLAQKASTTATGIRDTVRDAVQSRIGALSKAQQDAANAEAQRLQTASQAGMTPEAFYNALASTGQISAEDLAYMRSPEYAAKQAQYSPYSQTAQALAAKANNADYRTTTANTYTQAIDPRYQNLANVWNVQGADQIVPQATNVAYNTYGYNTGALGNVARNAATDAQMVRSIRGVASAGGATSPAGGDREILTRSIETPEQALEREYESGGTGGSF
jgi:nucleotide-binding universal stress UspA family protein